MPRTVVLIAGPPCSGKSTLARRLAADGGGEVLDRDDIARELGSPHPWAHTREINSAAEVRMRAEEQRIARATDIVAYVVRTLPVQRDRDRVARELGASEVRVLDPGMAECLHRAKAQGRPRWTYPAIRRWYERAQGAEPRPAASARSRQPAVRTPRAGRPWRALCAEVFRTETTCWLCGRWVDQELPPTHRLSRTADHVVPLMLGGVELDRGNVRLAHRSCNTARSNKLRSIVRRHPRHGVEQLLDQLAEEMAAARGPVRPRRPGVLIIDARAI